MNKRLDGRVESSSRRSPIPSFTVCVRTQSVRTPHPFLSPSTSGVRARLSRSLTGCVRSRMPATPSSPPGMITLYIDAASRFLGGIYGRRTALRLRGLHDLISSVRGRCRFPSPIEWQLFALPHPQFVFEQRKEVRHLRFGGIRGGEVCLATNGSGAFFRFRPCLVHRVDKESDGAT